MEIKRILFVFPFLFSLLSCSVISSSSSNENASISSTHIHEFGENINKKYLVAPADIFTGNCYYKSCSCGAVSKETFFDSSPLQYSFLDEEIFYNAKEFCKQALFGVPNNINISFPVKKVMKRRFLYATNDINNQRIIASGAISLPVNEATNKPEVKAFLLQHHGTFMDKRQCGYFYVSTPSLASLTGACVIEIDNLGSGYRLGIEPMIYQCSHLTNKVFLDGVNAAFSLLKQRYGVDKEGKKIFNSGYSQGAYDALSFLKYVETEPISDLKISKSYLGSGCYIPSIEINWILDNSSFLFPELLILGLLSTEAYHPEEFTDLRIKDFLTDYGEEFIPAVQTQDIFATSFLKLKTDNNGKLLFRSLADVFEEDLLNKEGYLRKKVISLAESESLINDGWIPEGNCYFYYSVDDDIVLPDISAQTIQSFNDQVGKNIEVETVENMIHLTASIDFQIKILNFLKDELSD